MMRRVSKMKLMAAEIYANHPQVRIQTHRSLMLRGGTFSPKNFPMVIVLNQSWRVQLLHNVDELLHQAHVLFVKLVKTHRQ